jgi:hypothetical protein
MMDDQLIGTIVEALADAEGVDPTELEYSLQEYVDLDALDRLANHDGAEWTFTFELPAYEVTVQHDGRVRVADIQNEGPLTPRAD